MQMYKKRHILLTANWSGKKIKSTEDVTAEINQNYWLLALCSLVKLPLKSAKSLFT